MLQDSPQIVHFKRIFGFARTGSYSTISETGFLLESRAFDNAVNVIRRQIGKNFFAAMAREFALV